MDTAYIRRLSRTCSGVRSGGRPGSLPSALAGSRPAFIRSLSNSTWQAPWAGIIPRKGIAAALSSEALMSSLMATMPKVCLVISAWIFTPSSKFRLNRFQPCDDNGVNRPNPGHQFVPGGSGHGSAGSFIGEDVLLPDSELLQYVELRLKVPGGIAGLAIPGVAVGKGDHEVNLAQSPLPLVGDFPLLPSL